MQNLEDTTKKSKIVLINKKELCINGVTKFVGSTQNAVSLVLDGEDFVVEGDNLVVLNLDTEKGELLLSGDVLKMSFEQKNNKFSFKKLFNR